MINLEKLSLFKKYMIDLFLSKENVKPYTPMSDYNPATKKYVDDMARFAPILDVGMEYVELSNQENSGETYWLLTDAEWNEMYHSSSVKVEYYVNDESDEETAILEFSPLEYGKFVEYFDYGYPYRRVDTYNESDNYTLQLYENWKVVLVTEVYSYTTYQYEEVEKRIKNIEYIPVVKKSDYNHNLCYVDFDSLGNVPYWIRKAMIFEGSDVMPLLGFDVLSLLYNDQFIISTEKFNEVMNEGDTYTPSTIDFGTDYYFVNINSTSDQDGCGQKITSKAFTSINSEFYSDLFVRFYGQNTQVEIYRKSDHDTSYSYVTTIECYNDHEYRSYLCKGSNVDYTYFFRFKKVYDDYDAYINYAVAITPWSILTKDSVDAISPILNKHNSGTVTLSSKKYQYINTTNATTIKLPVNFNNCNDIHLFIDTRPLLYIYKDSISSRNYWNGYGWSSQYIPVEPGSTIKFDAQTVTTNSIELIQYNAMDNVRKTPTIAKNGTVTLNSTTNYIKINCWDKTTNVPNSIFINGKEYFLSLTDSKDVAASAYTNPTTTANITLPSDCKYITKPSTFELNKVYELQFTKVDTIWTCRYLNDDSQQIDEDELNAALTNIFN